MSGSVRSLFAAFLLLNLSYAQTTISNVSSSDCPSYGGAHIIVARASTEAPGFGIIGAVKDQVLARVPGSTAEPVGYPATLSDYFNSETQGVIAMRELINAWAAKCEGTPLVLMGYSQGAQVTADSLVGQEDHGFTDNSTVDTPLPTSILARTAAVIIMGDPTFVTNETFHVGNASRNGIFPRQDVDVFNTAGLAGRTQSYCDDGDPYCDAGNDLAVHLGYIQEYGAAAADFVVANIKSFYGNSSVVGTNGTSSVAPTGTAVSTRTATPSGTGKSSPSGTGKTAPSGARNATATNTWGSTPTSSVHVASSTANAASSVGSLSMVGTVSGVLVGGFFAWLL